MRSRHHAQPRTPARSPMTAHFPPQFGLLKRVAPAGWRSMRKAGDQWTQCFANCPKTQAAYVLTDLKRVFSQQFLRAINADIVRAIW
jgi:hypothetical protein